MTADPNVVCAELVGHPLDLQRLAELFPTGELRIVTKDGDMVFLEDTTTLADLFEDPIALLEAAEQLLGVFIGYAMLDDPVVRAVRLTGSFYRGDGTAPHNRTVVGRAGSAEERNFTGAATALIDGKPVPPPPPAGPTFIALAATNSDVWELLTIFRRADGKPDWVDLYKIYEIIKVAVGGGREGLCATGWTDKSTLSAFTGSADRPDVSGDLARHARMSGGPPKQIMDLAEARMYIRRLAHAWLRSLT
jgi:hypothetical protein